MSGDYNFDLPMPLVLLLAVAQIAAAAAQNVLRTFDEDKIGGPPPGFVTAVGRDAVANRWIVTREGQGRVLLHQGEGSPPEGFAVAVVSGAQYHEVELSVRLKMVSGSRSAGLVWKYQDAQNHYVVQLDLGRQEVAVYRVSSGNRIRLEREDDLELDPDAWHSLKVQQREGQLRVYLGGIRVFTERDRQPRSRASVGLWAAGDSTVMFDDLRIQEETQQAQPSGKP